MKHLQGRSRVDLLVTDVGLPDGIDGRQLADAALALRPEQKVLFITGQAESAVFGHLRLGMHVLSKPFTIETRRHVFGLFQRNIKKKAVLFPEADEGWPSTSEKTFWVWVWVWVGAVFMPAPQAQSRSF